jgi:hypothetical protein
MRRVFLFLYIDDFWRGYQAYQSKDMHFVCGPKEETYGTMAVFEDV